MGKNDHSGKAVVRRGSEWRKWDLHVHTPASIVNSYGDSETDEVWEKYITDLENLPVEFVALGINDYFFLDGYKRLLDEQEKGRLEGLTLFPVVEFRVATFAGIHFKKLKRANLHVIFSNELDPDVIQDQFLNNLEQSYTLDQDGSTWECAVTRESLRELGADLKAKVPADKIKDFRDDLTEGFNNLNLDEKRIFELLTKRSQLRGKYLTAIGKTEWEALAWDDSSIATKKSIINKVDLVFTAAENAKAWVNAKKKLQSQSVNDLLLDCSDAHTYSDDSDKDRIGNCLTWIKAEPTFEGLVQILYAPDERVHVSDDDPREYDHAVISSFSSNMEEGQEFLLEKFSEFELSPYLTCVVGPRGAGKSTLLDGIAFSLGDEEVIDPDRSNYIGYYSDYDVDDIVVSDVRNTSVGERQKISPSSADSSGFLFDYYHQKYIGWLADPRQEETLSTFLFDKIFESTTDSETLFGELEETRADVLSQLRLNREEIVRCIHEIDKEAGIKEKIASHSSQKSFYSQPAIKKLLEERSVVVALRERRRRIEDRLNKASSKPIVGAEDILDGEFFENLKLSALDPKKAALPEAWAKIEKNASQLSKHSKTSQLQIKEEFSELVNAINDITGSWDIKKDLDGVFKKIEAKAAIDAITVTQTSLDKLDRLDKQIVNLKSQLEAIKQKKNDKKALKKMRKQIINDYNSELHEIETQLVEQFGKLLKTDGAILNNTVKVDIATRFEIGEYIEVIRSECKHRGSKRPRAPREKALLAAFRKLKPATIIGSFVEGDFSSWEGKGLGEGEIAYFEDLKNAEEVGMCLQEVLPNLTSRLYWRSDKSTAFKSLRECSIGERGTALLSVILVTGNEPLIIDQPEDDLDHFYLAKTLTPIIREVKRRRQLIFATHDANIVVNGDAEQIVLVGMDDGMISPMSTTIEDLNHRDSLINVLEGGKKAFNLRARRYKLSPR